MTIVHIIYSILSDTYMGVLICIKVKLYYTCTIVYSHILVGTRILQYNYISYIIIIYQFYNCIL